MHDIRPFLPQLFDNPGTLLYVGARPDAHSWLDELIVAKHLISILEIWEPNVAEMHTLYDISITLGSILEFDNIYYDKFDYIFWWHGPEHLDENQISTTLQALEKSTARLIALACPYGLYPQGTHEGNPYEEHRSTLYPEFFMDLGYMVKTDGQPDVAGSEIVAWKELE